MRDMIDVCIALFRLYSPTVNAVCRSVILSFKTENRSLFLYSALPLLFTIYERSDAAVSRRMCPHFQFYLLLFHIQRCVDPACRVSVTNSPPLSSGTEHIYPCTASRHFFSSLSTCAVVSLLFSSCTGATNSPAQQCTAYKTQTCHSAIKI